LKAKSNTYNVTRKSKQTEATLIRNWNHKQFRKLQTYTLKCVDNNPMQIDRILYYIKLTWTVHKLQLIKDKMILTSKT